MSDHPYDSPEQDGSQSARREKPRASGLWRWFALGFVLVFVGMALGVTTYTMLPSGDGVLRCRLWQYYIIEFRRAAGPNHLGPASGSTPAAIETAVFHVLFSALGGLVLTGIGWAVRRLRGQADRPANRDRSQA
jgi:hypothetical protein